MVLALSACSGGGETGHATTVGGASSASSPSSASLPQRPKDVKVDGVTDPCTLINAADQGQLSVSRVRNTQDNPTKSTMLPACSYEVSKPSASYYVVPIPTAGVDYWNQMSNITRQNLTVGGFPAVQFYFSGTSHVDCTVAVDVADGQQLYVDFQPTDRQYTQDTMCQNAQKAAGFALATLQSGK